MWPRYSVLIGHNATLDVVLITSVLEYFIVKFRESITLAVMKIFRWDKKCWIENEEEDTFIKNKIKNSNSDGDAVFDYISLHGNIVII